MQIKLKAKTKYSICSCGLSKTLPFCDNAHRQFNRLNDTNYKSVKITLDQDSVIEVTSGKWSLNKENKLD